MGEGIRRGIMAGTLILAGTSGAQPSLSGTLTWQGHPVAGAHVRLVGLNQEDVKEDITDSLGRFRFVRNPLGVAGPSAHGFTDAAAPEGTRDALGRAAEEASAARHRFRPEVPPATRRAPSAAKASAGVLRLAVTARGYRDTVAEIPDATPQIDIALAKDLRRHLWIWGGTTATSTAERDGLFAFARRKGIGTLYQDAGGLVRNDTAALAAFLRAAKAEGLAVELLFGAPQWALTANHAVPVDLARRAAALARALRSKGEPFPTSIQMDVEPYSLPAWEADREAVAGQLIDMYVKLAGELAGSGVGLTACIPRWFDGIPIAREGRTRPLTHWLADVTDRLTLMDYVDNARGILDGAAGELDHGDSVGTEVVIGVETVPDLEPETVTFAEEGEAAMEAALEEVRKAYASRRSYFGIAIHSYKHYLTMKP